MAISSLKVTDFRISSGTRYLQLSGEWYTETALNSLVQDATVEISIEFEDERVSSAVKQVMLGGTWHNFSDIEPILQSISGSTVKSKTATTYTLAAGDAGAFIEFDNASAITLTIPLNATVPLPTGFVVQVRQTGAGKVTAAVEAGVDLKGPGERYTTKEKWSIFSLIKVDTDRWALQGDTE